MDTGTGRGRTLRVATDIGGTFTDLVYLDEASGEVRIAKASTTPSAFELAVDQVLGKADIRPDDDISSFFHGSTVVINALTERKGATTALITTRGFRDVLELARSNRPDLFNLRYAKPKPFVERYLRFEVSERTDHRGEELEPLSEQDVRDAVAEARRFGATAFAVCFLHSYANPEHERECGRIVHEAFPEAAVTLSHEVCGEWREYERTNTAVLNAYVQPVVAAYVKGLRTKLEARNIRDHIYMMQSSGGSMTIDQTTQRPINMVESGPVAGVTGAVVTGEAIGRPNLITLDIGGTTAKTSLVQAGQAKTTSDYHIERTPGWAGYPIKVPVVDIVEIGAGGGSIAWLDEAGGLSVGPRSAGAEPGPACYGKGGTEPTVTDANLVVGRIDPDYFLGGEMEVSREAAEQAMRRIAEPLGLSVEQAALGIIRLANANMVNAIKLVSVRRGHDPRDFDLVAMGGGGSMHAGALAPELRIPRVVVPRAPAVFSAWGMLMTDLRADWVRTNVADVGTVPDGELEATFAGLEDSARAYFQDEGLDGSGLVLSRSADMRYRGQEHTVTVPFPAAVAGGDRGQLLEAFHSAHEQLYTFRLDSGVEIVNFRLTGLGVLQKPTLRRLDDTDPDASKALKGRRRVHFDAEGAHEASVYQREQLGAGARVSGPAIVEESGSTTVVAPSQELVVDEFGNLIITPAGGTAR
jgi:N-methylhydantoinase A